MNGKYRVLLHSSLVICGLLLCSQALASFPDVPSNHPNATAINYVQVQGIVQGYPDGTFRPDNTINRAEFAKIVMATRFSPDDIAACPHRPGRTGNIFPSDVGADQWFSAYVCRAIESGIIRGYPDGTFRPDRAINFVEAAKILSTSQISIELSEVADPWFANYVNAMASKAAIPSSITNFDQSITRGEMAEMIWRLKAEITDQPSKTYQDFLTTASPTVLEQIKQWTPKIHWSAIRSKLYPEPIGVDGTRTIPANSVESQGISVPQWNVGRALHTNLLQSGWSAVISLDADGVTGSQWGYQKREDNMTRFLIFRETASQCISNVDMPGVTCAHHETTVFYTDPVNLEMGASSVSTIQTIPYRNSTYGFHLDFPSGTTVEGGNGEFFELPIVTPRTNLTEKYLRISEETSSQCIAKGKGLQTITMNGNVFSKAMEHDVGAGQIYDATNYATEHRGICITFSFVLHSGNPDIFDPPTPLYDPNSESAIFEEILHSLIFE